MSRSSAVTVRQTPVPERAHVAGQLEVYARTVTVETAERLQLVDLTARVADVVRSSGIREGSVNIWSLHTTCAVMVNEFQRALLADIARVLAELVDREGGWMHNDPAHSDCDRANADSHLRAMLLGHGQTVQVSGGEPVLGQWQRILLAELDGPRTRRLRVQVSGIA